MDPRSGLADRLERPQKRVRGADLVVPVGPDQKQVPHLRVRDQVLEEVERRCIQPLQIVEEQRERVLLPCEYAEEPPENHLEAVLRILRRQLRNRRLFSDHELQLGNEVDDELTVRAQRLAQRIPPPAKLRLALAQKRAHQALEGLSQGGVWDVALVLVELAGREEPARRDEHLVQLVAPPRTCRYRNSRTRAPAPACRSSRHGRRRRAARRFRAPARKASPGSAAGPIHRARRAGTGRCVRATPIPSDSCLRSASTPAAVWYRSSAVLASSFITIAESGAGISFATWSGVIGCRAMWQCTHSIGSEAVKGSTPVSIS